MAIRKLIFTLTLLFSTVGLFAQTQTPTPTSTSTIELIPYAGYRLAGKVRFSDGDLKLGDNAVYGGMVNMQIRKGMKLSLNYNYSGSEARFYSSSILISNSKFDLNTHYFQLGIIREFELKNPKVLPYTSFSLGATWFYPSSADLNDIWRFSATLGGGLKYFFSDKVGIMVDVRMLSPLYFNGLGLFVGVGSGGPDASAGLSATSTVVQVDFTGGLVFKL